MVVKAKVTSGRGGFNRKGNLTEYTVREGSSPTIPGDTSGGVGSLEFSAAANESSYLLSGNEVELSDSERGTMRALVSEFTDEDGVLRVSTDNRLALLTVTRTLAPYAGTVGDLFRYCFELCNISTGYVIDASYDLIDIAVPGFTGEIWAFLKELCIPHGAEISLVSGNIWVRPIRTITATNLRDLSVSPKTSAQGLANRAEVYYYNSTAVNGGIVYLAAEGESPLQVEANQFATATLQTSVSLTEVEQPVAISEVAWAVSAGSTYVVSDINGTVSSGAWSAAGGWVTAEIDPEDNTKVIVTVRGANLPGAPFQIGVRVGSGEAASYASTLRIAGSGIRFEKRLFSQPTGVDPRFVAEDRATTVDNYAYATLEQAQDAACRLAGSVGGPQQTVHVVTGGLLRRGENHTGRYLTMDEFNTEYAGKTMTQFDALWTGKTFDQFNATYATRFAADFQTQAFGNVAGARVTIGDTIYRIRDNTTSPTVFNYSAECDTLMEDFNVPWSGATMDVFNAAFAGATMDEFNVAPLRHG